MTEHQLPFGWTLVTHDNCSLFVDTIYKNRFIVLDWDDDKIMTIIVDLEEFEVLSGFQVHQKFIPSEKKIILLNKPDGEDESLFS